MVEKSCQFLIFIFCYGATKLKKMVKLYVPTWTLFAGLITYSKCIMLIRYACMLHFDTSDQRNARTHISHIALPTSLKNLVIRNGGSTFLCTPSWRVYNVDVHSPFLIITYLVHLQALMFKLYILLDCWEVWYLRYANHFFYVSVIRNLKFHYFENSTSIFGKCLGM